MVLEVVQTMDSQEQLTLVAVVVEVVLRVTVMVVMLDQV
jgi:hypothetical protein